MAAVFCRLTTRSAGASPSRTSPSPSRPGAPGSTGRSSGAAQPAGAAASGRICVVYGAGGPRPRELRARRRQPAGGEGVVIGVVRRPPLHLCIAHRAPRVVGTVGTQLVQARAQQHGTTSLAIPAAAAPRAVVRHAQHVQGMVTLDRVHITLFDTWDTPHAMHCPAPAAGGAMQPRTPRGRTEEPHPAASDLGYVHCVDTPGTPAAGGARRILVSHSSLSIRTETGDRAESWRGRRRGGRSARRKGGEGAAGAPKKEPAPALPRPRSQGAAAARRGAPPPRTCRPHGATAGAPVMRR